MVGGDWLRIVQQKLESIVILLVEGVHGCVFGFLFGYLVCYLYTVPLLVGHISVLL